MISNLCCAPGTSPPAAAGRMPAPEMAMHDRQYLVASSAMALLERSAATECDGTGPVTRDGRATIGACAKIKEVIITPCQVLTGCETEHLGSSPCGSGPARWPGPECWIYHNLTKRQDPKHPSPLGSFQHGAARAQAGLLRFLCAHHGFFCFLTIIIRLGGPAAPIRFVLVTNRSRFEWLNRNARQRRRIGCVASRRRREPFGRLAAHQ